MGGCGLGIGYNFAVSTLIKCSLITRHGDGHAIMGFGGRRPHCRALS